MFYKDDVQKGAKGAWRGQGRRVQGMPAIFLLFI